jgi:hypothetical protein
MRKAAELNRYLVFTLPAVSYQPVSHPFDLTCWNIIGR